MSHALRHHPGPHRGLGRVNGRPEIIRHAVWLYVCFALNFLPDPDTSTFSYGPFVLLGRFANVPARKRKF
ncbi:hypothetical protein FG93_00151 [Bosea sp. LC85]|nr:hypothetical protein FG93_00151 [Bosea sp. LC85]